MVTLDRKVVVARMNPFGSEVFGTHIGTAKYTGTCLALVSSGENGHQEVGGHKEVYCCGGAFRTAINPGQCCLVCNNCEQVIPLGESKQIPYSNRAVCNSCDQEIAPKESNYALYNMWALMTCQIMAVESQGNSIFPDSRFWHYLPNKGSLVDINLQDSVQKCLVWENWAGGDKSLAVIMPQDWPMTQETCARIGVAGVHLVSALSSIHANAVTRAAESMRSAFGWLYSR